MEIDTLILKKIKNDEIVIKDKQLILFKKARPSLIAIIKAIQKMNLIDNLETTLLYNKKRINAITLGKVKDVVSPGYYNDTVIVLDWDTKSKRIKVDTISIIELCDLIEVEKKEKQLNFTKKEKDQLINSINQLTDNEKVLLMKKIMKEGIC